VSANPQNFLNFLSILAGAICESWYYPKLGNLPQPGKILEKALIHGSEKRHAALSFITRDKGRGFYF
jgi:hypothetical protein